MKIDPAMLMLSAANPMLLPMAISRGYDADRLSRITGGTVRHEHHGSVEHSFKPGSGDELRGIEVSAQRAFAAYSYAHNAFREFVETNAAVIAEMDVELERQANEIMEEQERKRAERKAKKAADLDELKERHRALLSKKHSTFWYFGKYDAEIRGLELKLAMEEEGRFGHFDIDFYSPVRASLALFEHKPSAQVERQLKRLGDLHAVAAVAHGTQHMSRDEVLEIHRIEQPGWLESQGIYKRVQAHIASKTV